MTRLPDKRMELTEHLGELRTRIMRAALYVLICGAVTYIFFPQLYKLITGPIMSAVKTLPPIRMADGMQFPAMTIVFRNFMAPFFLRIKLSAEGGLTVALPLIVLEIWGFISPGLRDTERRPFRLMAPFSAFLFLFGVCLGFHYMGPAVKWFLRFLPNFPGAILLQDPEDYVDFVTQMLLVCGLVFQLPIVLVALGKFGIVRSTTLTKYWRHAVVAVFTLAMIASPSPDPMSMVMIASPLVLLYIISIFLVRMVEPPLSG